MVLQTDITQACGGMILTQPDLLASCLDLVRIPAMDLWLEWDNACLNPEAELHTGGRGQRAGMLVECDLQGRAGVLRSFWESPEGVETSSASLHFDLDSMNGVLADSAVDSLRYALSHTRMEMDEEWKSYYAKVTSGVPELSSALAEIRDLLWKDLLVLLSFSLMTGMRSELVMRPSELQQLNKARRKRRVPDLLEFLEVSASLCARTASAHTSGSGGGRTALRLHHVRGHFVRRGEALYWRRPHLRGDAVLGRAPARVTRVALSAGMDTPIT